MRITSSKLCGPLVPLVTICRSELMEIKDKSVCTENEAGARLSLSIIFLVYESITEQRQSLPPPPLLPGARQQPSKQGDSGDKLGR